MARQSFIIRFSILSVQKSKSYIHLQVKEEVLSGTGESDPQLPGYVCGKKF